MHIVGYGLIALGMIVMIGALGVTLGLEHRPQLAARYGTQFTRDASMFGTRILGAVLILCGSVLNIAAYHLSR